MEKRLLFILMSWLLPIICVGQIELKSDFTGYSWATFAYDKNLDVENITVKSQGIHRFSENEIHVLTIPSDTITISVDKREFTFVAGKNEDFNPNWSNISSLDSLPALKREEVNALKYYLSLYFLNSSLPDFCTKDTLGNTFSSHDLKGKLTVLSFWFYGCAPCKAVIPELNTIKNEFSHDESIRFLAFSADKELMHPELFDFHHFPDSKNIGNDFLVWGYPQTFIVDQNGIVRDVFPGASMDDNTYLRENMKRRIREIQNTQ